MRAGERLFLPSFSGLVPTGHWLRVSLTAILQPKASSKLQAELRYILADGAGFRPKVQ